MPGIRYPVWICLAAILFAQQRDGYKDTPILPGQKWHVHDSDRPNPRVIVPGRSPGAPPSDAIVLFDGKDLSHWEQRGQAPRWKVADGSFEVEPGTGDLRTREKFGDCQLHIEWSSPTPVRGVSQERGNSGVYLMDRYEIQVLDSYQNPTYADGQAGALYGQWPPLVNPARPPGEWNAFDIIFEAPRFDGEKLIRPAFATVLYNGVLVHHHKELNGPTEYRVVLPYKAHGEEPIHLQDHGTRVRYRNVWVRRPGAYDQP